MFDWEILNSLVNIDLLNNDFPCISSTKKSSIFWTSSYSVFKKYNILCYSPIKITRI